ncbi:hypothetical protein RHMOL_Rhmol10G0120300 [Rhododendron molle]|uniref:Uncharacterized protein n=1 Tax=Rhododendron molle TaxID=49168 RepID=A0ACC0M1K9_RHOML|nr:hypothetical protein RHMOL_Rhmol10G0120300 [Rhododendron molle]
MSTTETQAGSEIVERKHQGDICDPWIYFGIAVAAIHGFTSAWLWPRRFAILNKLDQVGDDELLLPALDPELFRLRCRWVHLICFRRRRAGGGLEPSMTRDVFYIDSLCPEKGWKKLNSSLNRPGTLSSMGESGSSCSVI